jgi:hypothetical protein
VGAIQSNQGRAEAGAVGVLDLLASKGRTGRPDPIRAGTERARTPDLRARGTDTARGRDGAADRDR